MKTMLLFFLLLNTSLAFARDDSAPINNPISPSTPRVTLSPNAQTLEEDKHFFKNADTKHLQKKQPESDLTIRQQKDEY